MTRYLTSVCEMEPLSHLLIVKEAILFFIHDPAHLLHNTLLLCKIPTHMKNICSLQKICPEFLLLQGKVKMDTGIQNCYGRENPFL